MVIETGQRQATVEDLYRVEGKAELVHGRVIREPPPGYGPSRRSADIHISLRQHERKVGGGVAVPDNCAFIVDLPDRQSFSPDAAWFTGPTTGMKFLEGAPDFAAEVRSEHDYGPAAELADELAAMHLMSDDALLAAVHPSLSAAEQERLTQVNALAGERALTAPEAAEQLALAAAFQRSVLRRAQAAAILAQRGHDAQSILRQAVPAP